MRSDRLFSLIIGSGFSVESYLKKNADLARHNMSQEGLVMHWVHDGIFEWRPDSFDFKPKGILRLRRYTRNSNFKYVGDLVFSRYLAHILQSEGLGRTLQVFNRMRSNREVPLLAIGDSHITHPYAAIFPLPHVDVVPIVYTCRAGSAKGLANPQSRSGYNQKIRALLTDLATLENGSVPVLFKFGQVDVEFVFSFKRMKNRELSFNMDAAHSYIESVVDEYVEFLRDAVSADLVPQVFVSGVFAPTLHDEAVQRGYFNPHVASLEDIEEGEYLALCSEMEHPPLTERLRMHQYFNEILKKKIKQNGLNFIDDGHFLLDSDGSVLPQFVNRFVDDHHIYVRQAEPVFLPAIETLNTQAQFRRRSVWSYVSSRLSGMFSS